MQKIGKIGKKAGFFEKRGEFFAKSFLTLRGKSDILPIYFFRIGTRGKREVSFPKFLQRDAGWCEAEKQEDPIHFGAAFLKGQ